MLNDVQNEIIENVQRVVQNQPERYMTDRTIESIRLQEGQRKAKLESRYPADIRVAYLVQGVSDDEIFSSKLLPARLMQCVAVNKSLGIARTLERVAELELRPEEQVDLMTRGTLALALLIKQQDDILFKLGLPYPKKRIQNQRRSFWKNAFYGSPFLMWQQTAIPFDATSYDPTNAASILERTPRATQEVACTIEDTSKTIAVLKEFKIPFLFRLILSDTAVLYALTDTLDISARNEFVVQGIPAMNALITLLRGKSLDKSILVEQWSQYESAMGVQRYYERLMNVARVLDVPQADLAEEKRRLTTVFSRAPRASGELDYDRMARIMIASYALQGEMMYGLSPNGSWLMQNEKPAAYKDLRFRQLLGKGQRLDSYWGNRYLFTSAR